LYTNGCSWTFGSELRDPYYDHIKDDFDPVHNKYREEHNWSTLLSQNYNLELFNGSQAGAGTDRILRTTMADVIALKRKGRKPFVVLAWSHIQRFELPDNPEGTQYRSYVGPSSSIKNPPVVDEIFGNYSTDRTDLIRWMQSMILLDGFFKTQNIPYYSTSVFDSNRRMLEKFQTDVGLEPYYYGLKFYLNVARQPIKDNLDDYIR